MRRPPAIGLLAAGCAGLFGLAGCRENRPAPARPPPAAQAPSTPPSTPGSDAAPTASHAASSAAPPPLVWQAHPAGHFDAAGRLCMPKVTPSGACKPELRDPDLCALPDCALRLSASPAMECCFAPRFRSDPAHRCVLAVETLAPHDGQGCGAPPCAGCGALSVAETTRVRTTLSRACCYAAP